VEKGPAEKSVVVAGVRVDYHGPLLDVDVIRVRTRSQLICKLIAQRLLELIKHFCPVLRGFPRSRWYPPPLRLRESFVIKEYRGGKGYYITCDDLKAARYLPYVHEGTSPHIIVPRRRKALCFWKREEQDWKVRKMVYHPGAPAQPFIKRAIETLEQELDRIILWGVREIGRPG